MSENNADRVKKIIVSQLNVSEEQVLQRLVSLTTLVLTPLIKSSW